MNAINIKHITASPSLHLRSSTVQSLFCSFLYWKIVVQRSNIELLLSCSHTQIPIFKPWHVYCEYTVKCMSIQQGIWTDTFFGLISIRTKKFESTDHHIKTTIIGSKMMKKNTQQQHESEWEKENEKEREKKQHKIDWKAKYDGIVCGRFYFFSYCCWCRWWSDGIHSFLIVSISVLFLFRNPG